MDAGSSSSSELPQPFRQFTISEIHLATRNFDESLVIGHGGFGMVYKGTITNGETNLVVAIKRLDSTSNQGALEFWNEVQMLSKLRHCHLVSLIGYCNHGQEMILVYEYMPHGTLEDHLHKFQSPLTWVRRLKICIGAARGLDYLHTGAGIKHRVIHRDVKSSNILLDDSWAAKISDFGLSKLGPINRPTYVNTFVKGTFGYLDPDYYATGRLTRKSDVYAFGVVLLEVLSGKRAVDSSLDEEHWGLINWAQESMKEGRLKQIVDSNIRERILPKCLKEFGRLADWCLHSNPKKRPTMAEVVACLEYVLGLQEKADNTLHPPGIRIFGNRVPMFMSWSNVEKFGGGKRSLELYFDTIGDKNKILSRFEFETINVATNNFSDIFSFGVLIFETISGYRLFDYVPASNLSLLEDVFRNWLEGSCSNMIDPRFHANLSSITRFIHIGLLCVQLYQADRPTMKEVVGMLTDGAFLTLPVPKIYTSHWMLEKYSVPTNVVRTDAVQTYATYTAMMDLLLVNDYDHGAVSEFLSELHPR